MAVSKRLRYEVLRRDNHACRYCGATAPDVKLNVDHVIPKSLGGIDTPTNLVTSCADCNSGKTSSLPNADPIADVDQETFRQDAYARATNARPSHDPQTGHPTSWSFRDVELAMVESAWRGAWVAVAPEGPDVSHYESFFEQVRALAERGVDIGAMLAAAVMAGSQGSPTLTWGVPSQVNRLPLDDERFSLGCDVLFAWEAAWEAATGERPPNRSTVLFIEEMSSALCAGRRRATLLEAAGRAGSQQCFYLSAFLSETESVGGDR